MVTGGTGAIGSELLRLLSQSCSTTPSSRPAPRSWSGA